MENLETAISIQQSLFEQVEDLVRQLNIPRSRVFELAVEEFVQRQENRQLLAQLNEVYADMPDAEEKEQMRQMRCAQWRLMEVNDRY